MLNYASVIIIIKLLKLSKSFHQKYLNSFTTYLQLTTLLYFLKDLITEKKKWHQRIRPGVHTLLATSSSGDVDTNALSSPTSPSVVMEPGGRRGRTYYRGVRRRGVDLQPRQDQSQKLI